MVEKDSTQKKRRKLPSGKQWRQFFRALSRKEKAIFFLLFLAAIVSVSLLGGDFYLKNTKLAPTAGGSYREGVIGQPRFINPLYLSNQDVDRDLVELLFSGLMKYNGRGEIVEDLVERVEIQEEEKIFEVFLKENILWHDGESLDADDVIFTLNLIQDPQYNSPLWIKWAGITAEKISNNAIRFKLPKKYSGFLENLTLKILPKHVFEDISPANLPWGLISQEYLIGSGPFKFKELAQDRSGYIKKIVLERNANYYSEKPFLEEVSFLFYDDTKDLLRAATVREIDGFPLTDPKYFKDASGGYFNTHLLAIPRYFALFFNLGKKNIFSEKNLREALSFSANKEGILEAIFLEKGSQVHSPILPNFFGFEPPVEVWQFNREKAAEILEAAGFKLNPETGKREKTTAKEAPFIFKRDLVYKSEGEDVIELQKCLAKDPEVYPEGTVSGYFGTQTKVAVIRFQEKYAEDILHPIGLTKGTGDIKPMTREKLNQICFETPKETTPFEFTLTTCDKFPLVEMAEKLKEEWQAIGATVKIEKVSLSDLQTNTLAKRSFELLLFGEALGSIPDPFPFWHSSQKEYPGLNISSYESKEADKLLEKARETQAEEERKESLEEFQNILVADLPAIFLIRPDYVYMLAPTIKGFAVQKVTEPAKRFSTIEQWYIETKRVWK